MKHLVGVIGRYQPLGPSARIVTAIIATAAVGLPAAAQGTSPAATASKSSNVGKAVAYAKCMRSHGVPNYPDPGSDGVLPKIDVHQLGVSQAQFAAANSACQHLLPNSSASIETCFDTGICTEALRQQLMNGMLRFAQCMRQHGVTNFPDPTVMPNGAPVIKLGAVPGTNWRSAQIEKKLAECGRALPNVRVALNRPGP
jgi:hypothetical protein